MDIIITQNGSTTMYISPKTEIEKLLLQSLFSGPVESKQHNTIQVGDKQMVDCIQITCAPRIPTVASN